MRFFQRRKFRSHPNHVVQLAVKHYDRPTDLKNAFIENFHEFERLQSQVKPALDTLSSYPEVCADIRLAFLRSVCTVTPEKYAELLTKFPQLNEDHRARASIELYKQRTLNQFLGVEESDDSEDSVSSIFVFDDSMFENTEHTEFEAMLDDDYGLIELADDGHRTLNQLRDRIHDLIRMNGVDHIVSVIQRIQAHLLREGYDDRAINDFFVASLRVLGELDSVTGIAFGRRFFSQIPDPRGLRSMVIFLRRNGEILDSLRLLHHPKFNHDETTLGWVQDLTEIHKEMMLDGKLKPKYDQFKTDYAQLEEYMQLLYESMDADHEIARYNYGYALRIHKNTPERPLARSVIKWGEILLLSAETYSDTVSIHVSNAYINLGQISEAIRILTAFANPDSARIIAKLRGYRDLNKLRSEGFDVNIEVPKEGFEPIPGRVLYVLHNSLPYNSGGYATRGHGLMRGVKELGWDVQVVTRRGYPHDRKGMSELPTDALQIIDDIPYHRLIELKKGYGQINIAAYLEAYANDLARKVIELRPSILHAASNHLNGLVANAVARHFNLPSIYEVRGLWEITRISRQPEFEGSEYFQMMSRLEAQSAEESKVVFTITHALAEEMRSRIEGQIDVGFLPNGVHADRFVPLEPDLELKSSLGLHPETVVLGYIGSLVSYEGLDLLIESLPSVKERTNTPFKLMIVGDGAYMEKLQRLTHDLGLDDDVMFVGRVPHEEVERYYSIVDIAPFPRLPQPVTEMVSPLKPFEAMAMEKAVIASNVQALSEIVIHDETGILFRKGDPSDLAEKLADLINDSELRSVLGKNSRTWVCEHRDWSKISNTLHQVYEKLEIMQKNMVL
jgi:glycosyltransferase involved in cell wall biosynthesis